MNKGYIRTLIEKSLKRLVERDGELIHRKVREECINHMLACYLEQFLNEESNDHPSYKVDLEYDKNYNEPKEIIDEDNNTKAVRPDIIVHERGTNERNLVAFEIKKGYTDRHDLEKIKGLLRSPYNYVYGSLISYLPTKGYIRIKLLSDGGREADLFRVDKKRLRGASAQQQT